MEKIWQTILIHKSNPLVWPCLVVLWFASLVYRLGLEWRNRTSASEIKTSAPLISVGNLTVGGAGKTPMTIELAEFFLQKGKTVAIVSRGYGRASTEVVQDFGHEIQKMPVGQVGDEVMMMAEMLPSAVFAVSESKSEVASMVDRDYRPDVIIVDDGFQNRRLHRDLNILLLDAGLDIRAESLFPLGRLREPMKAVKRADWIVLTKAGPDDKSRDYVRWVLSEFEEKIRVSAVFHNDSIVCGSKELPVSEVSSKRIYFFAGVGNFEALSESIGAQFHNIVGMRNFPDHCRYDKSDLELIMMDIRRLRPEYAVTTHKDIVKIRDFDFGQPVYYLSLRLRFEPAESHLFDVLGKMVKD